MRIDEGKGGFARQRDTLPRRRKAGIRWPLRQGDPPRRTGAERGDIDMLAQEGRILDQRRLQIGVFGRLHQPQMALGQDQIAPARQRAKDADPGTFQPQPAQPLMPG